MGGREQKRVPYREKIPLGSKFDELVKRRKPGFSVIPAKSGIQLFQPVLDPGFRRGDDDWDFLRVHQ